MPSREKIKKAKMLKITRISFAIYILLLVVLCANLFFIVNKDYVIYEMVAAGLVYLFNMRLVLRSMNDSRSAEITFYFLSHVIVAVCIIFLMLADSISNTAPAPVGVD